MSDALAEIKALYYGATKQTIHEAFDRAIDLLKTLPSEDDRERATVYMQGLAEMKREWWSDSAESEGRSAKSAARHRQDSSAKRHRNRKPGNGLK